MTTLVIDGAVEPSPKELSEAVAAHFGLQISEGELDEALHRLTSRGLLVATADRQLAPSSSARDAVESRSNRARELEATVRSEWSADLQRSFGMDLPEGKLWSALLQFNAAMFREHGIETIALLQPPETTPDLGSLQSWVAEAAKSAGLGGKEKLVRSVLELFFNHHSEAKDQYLAQLLDSTFTFYALTLDDATASFLRGTLPAISIFFDTNFIFGLLGLHDNPLNDVSSELISVIRERKFQFKLYYHERTLREIEQTLFAVGQRLRNRKWQQALSRGAVQAGTLSGVELRYHRLNSEQPIDPDVFLSKYEKIPALLDEFGVSIYRSTETKAEEQQRWALAAELNDLVTKWRPGRPRRYEAVDHDVTLWRTVRGIRRTERPTLASGALILTVDRVLHRFDRHMARAEGITPSVVLPAQLMQVIRPFVPGTSEFDRRFVEAFAIPEFRGLIGDYASTASKVSSYLATYKDVPEPTAVRLLRDELLMDRLKERPEESPDFREAVDNALVKANSELVATNAALVRRLESEKSTSSSKQLDYERRLGELAEELAELKRSTQEAEDRHPGVMVDHTSAMEVLPHPTLAADVRLPALILAGVIFLVCVRLWFWIVEWNDAIAQHSFDPLIGRPLVAALGALGALATSLVVLIIWRGVVQGRVDYLRGSVKHRVFLAASVLVLGALLVTIWGLQG